MSSPAEIQVLNEEFLSQVTNPGMIKNAADAVTAFTRSIVREDAINRKVMPMVPVSNSDLTPEVQTDKPSIVVEKEPGSPAAVTIPFGHGVPAGWHIQGDRYRVQFVRLQTPRFYKDVDELRTYRMDIRQVISDNAVRDLLTAEDDGFFAGLEVIMPTAAPDAIVAYSGVAQYQTIWGGLNRDGLQESFKILPSTPSHLEVQTVVCNNLTIREILKGDGVEMTQDISAGFLKQGWTGERFMNADWIISIKRNLVPDNELFFFGDPRFLGKNFLLQDVVMVVKAEGPMIEFWAYESIGAAIGNTNAVARAKFR